MNEAANTSLDTSLLTKAEAAKVLRVSPITVHRMIRQRRLGSYRIGARVFTTQQFINEFLQKHARKPDAK